LAEEEDVQGSTKQYASKLVMIILGAYCSVGWSDELYPVYIHPPLQPTPAHDPIAFAIERAAVPLFGLVNFGCLLTGKKFCF
jgi:hypothetical protein